MSAEPAAGERIELDLVPPELIRQRGRLLTGAIAVALVVAGVLIGVTAGWLLAVIMVVVLGVPLLWFALGVMRRGQWLTGGVVFSRGAFDRSVDLRRAERIELLITAVRGQRMVAMLVSGPPKGRTVNIPLATYVGQAGAEQGVLPLRRLADALVAGEQPQGLVFAELLVAQLRAEAREEGAEGRPLYRLAALGPAGGLARRLRPDEVTRFVSSLD